MRHTSRPFSTQNIRSDALLHNCDAVNGYLKSFTQQASQNGFSIIEFGKVPGEREYPLLAAVREADSEEKPNIYLSTGIHGDEPAGPLALLRLLEIGQLPEGWGFVLFPLLNPVGMVEGMRENSDGVDMNRDFRHTRSTEIRAAVKFIKQLRGFFDLAIILHEDWESRGFYLYEHLRNGTPSLAPPILKAAASVLPVDTSSEIDGWEARDGIALPRISPEIRQNWPETIFLLARRYTQVAYNLETPSSFPLKCRVAAHTRAVQAALKTFAKRN